MNFTKLIKSNWSEADKGRKGWGGGVIGWGLKFLGGGNGWGGGYRLGFNV